jgi:hypothetical protein
MNNPQSFWALLLGADTYSTQRAKWFYAKAESIFNVVIKILLILGLIFLIFTFVMNPYMGMLQLLIDVFVIFFLIVFVIFNKLLFMAVGALIRIGEILEENSNSITQKYIPSSSTLPPQSAVVSNNVVDKNKTDRNFFQQSVEEKNNLASFDTQSNELKKDPERENFDNLRLEATRKLASRGHVVSMQGDYPMNKWQINYKDGKTKRISTIEELLIASVEVEN